jgi:hypothetical protein
VAQSSKHTPGGKAWSSAIGQGWKMIPAFISIDIKSDNDSVRIIGRSACYVDGRAEKVMALMQD